MMNKKIKKSKRPLQVKLMIAVTVIAVLVIIPLTSNIMEDVFRITVGSPDGRKVIAKKHFSSAL